MNSDVGDSLWFEGDPEMEFYDFDLENCDGSHRFDCIAESGFCFGRDRNHFVCIGSCE